MRRVFAIDVERSRALEWSVALGAWRDLGAAGHITDPALRVPLPIETILHAVRTDDAVLRALIAKGNPVLEVHVAERRAQARAEAKAEAVLAVLAARRVAVGGAERVRILEEQNPAQLDRWIAEAATCADVGELFTTTRRR